MTIRRLAFAALLVVAAGCRDKQLDAERVTLLRHADEAYARQTAAAEAALREQPLAALLVDEDYTNDSAAVTDAYQRKAGHHAEIAQLDKALGELRRRAADIDVIQAGQTKFPEPPAPLVAARAKLLALP